MNPDLKYITEFSTNLEIINKINELIVKRIAYSKLMDPIDNDFPENTRENLVYQDIAIILADKKKRKLPDDEIIDLLEQDIVYYNREIANRARRERRLSRRQIRRDSLANRGGNGLKRKNKKSIRKLNNKSRKR